VRTATHDLTIGSAEVFKRFLSWQRGEPDREWAALAALADHAPGLAPKPLRRTVDRGWPIVVMSRLPGAPLGDRAMTPRQVAAVAAAMTELHDALPAAELTQFPQRIWGAADALRACRVESPAGLQGDTRRAFVAGAEWIESTEASSIAEEDGRSVLAQGDGNIANFLWDGDRCRLVDFEDGGRGDPAFEVADLVEHPSTRLSGVLVADDLLRLLALDPAASQRVLSARRVFAFYWLLMLLPGGSAHRRNPHGSKERQARHLLELLA
jgi:aminoglycoside phosphotransferase